MDDKSPNNSNESGGRVKTSSSLAVVPKKPDDLVEEEISSEILSILGLEDVFDLTYEEYASLLKEKAVQGRMTGSKMTTESVELVTNELKRVRGKTGRFKVKQKKIDINKVLNRKPSTKPGAIVKKPALARPVVAPAQEMGEGLQQTQKLEGDLLNGLGSILESLVVIRTILQNQNNLQKKSVEGEKKTVEKQKRKERERKLESKKGISSKEGDKLKAPVSNFFDAIKRFVTNVLLGSVVLGLFKWLKNPVNKKAIGDFTKFLTDNAPLILGGLLAIAALPIASSLLGLTGAILGGIPTLIGALGFFATPAGLAALAAAAGVALFSAGKIIPKVFPKTVDEQERLIQQKIKEQNLSKEQAIKKLKEQKKNLNPLQIIQGVGSEIDEQIYKLETGETKSYQFEERKTSSDLGYRVGRGLFGALKDLPAGMLGQLQGKDNDALKRQRQRGSNLMTLLTTGQLNDSTSISKSKSTQNVKPQTPAVSDYKSPFAGARDKEALKASKITGNAPITVGEKAGYSASRGRIHAGRDIAAPSGTGLQVPSDSVITDKGFEKGYGNFVVFKDANGVEHLYGHMLEASPYNKGDSVSAGTVIGRVGSTGHSTGPHLHWEVSRVMGEVGRPRQNIIDPIEMGFPAQAPFTGKVEAARIAPSAPSVPSIPSPTGGNIAMLPLPLGAGQQQQGQSNSAPLQTPVPSFSSEDPNNMTTLVVKAIYNVVG